MSRVEKPDSELLRDRVNRSKDHGLRKPLKTPTQDKINEIVRASNDPSPPAPPPQPNPPAPAENFAPRKNEMAGTVKFALTNPGSKAAKLLGVTSHGLSPQEIDELDGRVHKIYRDEKPGFLQGLWDWITTAFECLTGSLSKDGRGFGQFSQIRAEKSAMRCASKIYEALHMESADKTRPYDKFARSVSGVEPDGNGGYKPVLDADGKPTGIYAEELNKITNPRETLLATLQDRGLQPTQRQADLMEEKTRAAIDDLYKDATIKQIAANLRPEPNTPGKDTEAKRFVGDPQVMEKITAIADKLIADEDIKKSGSFDLGKRRDELIGKIKWRIAGGHVAKVETLTLPPKGPVVMPPPPLPTTETLTEAINAAGDNAKKAEVVKTAWQQQIFEALKTPNDRVTESAAKTAMAAALADRITQEYLKADNGLRKETPSNQIHRITALKNDFLPNLDADTNQKLKTLIETLAPITSDAVQRTNLSASADRPVDFRAGRDAEPEVEPPMTPTDPSARVRQAEVSL